jgi:hypothetical protein
MGETGVTQSASADLATAAANETTNMWRGWIGRIWTEMNDDLFGPEDKMAALAKMTYEEFLSMTPYSIQKAVDEHRVRVVFRYVPKDDLDSLLTKYAVGIVTWKELVQASRSLSNQDSSDETAFPMERDPWSQLEKLSMTNARTAALTASLGEVGNVVFPELPKPTADQNGEKNGKKKAKAKTKSSAAKHKRDESGASSPKGKAKAKKSKTESEKHKDKDDGEGSKKKTKAKADT